jgi:phosphate uptake regulator
LLACLKFITDLERVGDLVMLHHRTAVVSKTDRQELMEMASILCEMLEVVHLGFATNNPECGRKVLLTDARVDASCRALFQRHLASKQASPTCLR